MIFSLIFLAPYYRHDPQPIKIRIFEGDNLRHVADVLDSNNVIFSENLFTVVGRVVGYDKKILPGEYTFQNGLTLWDALNIIISFPEAKNLVLIVPEGINSRQIGRILTRQHGLDSAKFVSYIYNDSLASLTGTDLKSLEGFLYPDTYYISAQAVDTEKKIIQVMFETWRKKFTQPLLDSIRQKNMKLKDVMIMASIIQGETRQVHEMSRIAGVYYNRLKKGMRLQADPTVQYALPEFKARLKYSDLRVNSPYNTYLHKGLPPGPIGNPAIDAIRAAVNPETHNYIYFVAKGDGSHTFASTYAQHQKNVAAFRSLLERIRIRKEQQAKDSLKLSPPNILIPEKKPVEKKAPVKKKPVRKKRR